MSLYFVEILERSTQGRTEPYICRCDDGEVYFIKGQLGVVDHNLRPDSQFSSMDLFKLQYRMPPDRLFVNSLRIAGLRRQAPWLFVNIVAK